MKSVLLLLIGFLGLFILFSGCVTEDIDKLITQNKDVNAFISMNPNLKLGISFYDVNSSNELILKYGNSCPNLVPKEYVVVNFILDDSNQDITIILLKLDYSTSCIIKSQIQFVNNVCDPFKEQIISKRTDLENIFQNYISLGCESNLTKEVYFSISNVDDNCNNYKSELDAINIKIQDINKSILTCNDDIILCDKLKEDIDLFDSVYSELENKKEQLDGQINNLEKELSNCTSGSSSVSYSKIISTVKLDNSFCPDLVSIWLDQNRVLQDLTSIIKSKEERIILLTNQINQCKNCPENQKVCLKSEFVLVDSNDQEYIDCLAKQKLEDDQKQKDQLALQCQPEIENCRINYYSCLQNEYPNGACSHPFCLGDQNILTCLTEFNNMNDCIVNVKQKYFDLNVNYFCESNSPIGLGYVTYNCKPSQKTEKNCIKWGCNLV